MSRSRNRGRSRNRAASAGGQSAQGSQGQSGQGQDNGNRSQGNQKQGGQNNQSQNSKGRRRRRGSQPRQSQGSSFWGELDALPEPKTGLRISEVPDAVVRSLGPPPLPGREQIAGHYFAAIYQRAVMTAGALAASGGLIDTEMLEREFEDSED